MQDQSSKAELPAPVPEGAAHTLGTLILSVLGEDRPPGLQDHRRCTCGVECPPPIDQERETNVQELEPQLAGRRIAKTSRRSKRASVGMHLLPHQCNRVYQTVALLRSPFDHASFISNPPGCVISRAHISAPSSPIQSSITLGGPNTYSDYKWYCITHSSPEHNHYYPEPRHASSKRTRSQR